MARAARGRADGPGRARPRRGRRGPARASAAAAASSPSSAAGTTAATPCMPSPRSPRRAWPPPWCTVLGAPARGRAGGGDRGRGRGRRLARRRRRPRAPSSWCRRRTSCSTASSASAAGPGCRPRPRPWCAPCRTTSMVVAVDLPSGADPAGEVSAPTTVFADETVTFGDRQAGAPAAGDRAGGRGAHRGRHRGRASAAPAVSAARPTTTWPRCGRCPAPADDKYSRGVLGVVAGGEGYTGAPLLSVTAAVGAGAGMVRYVGPPTPTALVRSRRARGGARRRAGAGVGGRAGPRPRRRHRARPGPARRRAARRSPRAAPCVVDAGGLDLLERGPATAPTLLTPHAGELARLLTRLGPAGRARRGHGRPAPARPAARRPDRRHRPAQGRDHPRRRPRPRRGWCARRPTRRRGSPPPGPVTCWPASPAPCSPPGLSPLDAGSLARLVHGVAGDAANPGGPVRALAVAHAIPAVVAGLLARGRAPVLRD